MAERRHSVSGQLLTLRRELGLTQAEVAARMGTSQSAVARFEAGDLDVGKTTGAKTPSDLVAERHAAKDDRVGRVEHLGVTRHPLGCRTASRRR